MERLGSCRHSALAPPLEKFLQGMSVTISQCVLWADGLCSCSQLHSARSQLNLKAHRPRCPWLRLGADFWLRASEDTLVLNHPPREGCVTCGLEQNLLFSLKIQGSTVSEHKVLRSGKIPGPRISRVHPPAVCDWEPCPQSPTGRPLGYVDIPLYP